MQRTIEFAIPDNPRRARTETNQPNMAATMSPWSKPGAWALDSEENEAELLQPLPSFKGEPVAAASDFPSLAAAASTKPSKKKKAQTLSLAEFSTGHSVSQGSARSASATAAKGLTPAEMQALPTGPRERTAEELERSRGGFRGFDNGRGGGGRYSTRDDSPNSRWGSSRASDDKLAPSRADEIDDWGAAKKSSFGSGFERRDREKGAFFDSHSRADESDSWTSKKIPLPPSSEGRRYGSSFGGGFDRDGRRGGFDSGNGGGADSDFWGKKKEEGIGNGGGADSDFWGKKREEGVGNASGGGGAGRPRLNLQPRTLPVSNNQPQEPVSKPKGSNPFGEARPREEVLAEKGQDWKKIDEQLESLKIKEGSAVEGIAFGKKNFGSENGRGSFHDDRTEKSWRKPTSVGSSPSSPEEVENNSNVAEN